MYKGQNAYNPLELMYIHRVTHSNRYCSNVYIFIPNRKNRTVARRCRSHTSQVDIKICLKKKIKTHSQSQIIAFELVRSLKIKTTIPMQKYVH